MFESFIRLLLDLRFIAARQAMQTVKMHKSGYRMQLRMTNLLDAQIQHDCISLSITVTSRDMWDVLKKRCPIWVLCCHGLSQTLLGLACFSVLLCSYQPPSSCNIYWTSYIYYIYRFFYCEEVCPVAGDPVCRRFVTLLFMQAGDYMQSINCPSFTPSPLQCNVCNSVITLLVQRGAGDHMLISIILC